MFPLVCCYIVYMFSRLLSFILIAVALTLTAWTKIDPSQDLQTAVSVGAIQTAIAFHKVPMAMPCGRCKEQACGLNTVLCCASCAAESALGPETAVLAIAISELRRPRSLPVARDRRKSPDLHPPRPISIS